MVAPGGRRVDAAVRPPLTAAVKLLALDTSSDACSVAVDRDGEIVERHVVRPKEHTRLLLPMIEECLSGSGVTIPELDAVVAGIGPGSFIGVRIAVSVAQGIAFAGGRRTVPVSSLAAVAGEGFARSDAERIIVAQDAHMQQVYLARFVRGAGQWAEPAGEATLHGIAAIEALEQPGAGRWHAAGAGWHRYPELLGMNEARLAGVLEVDGPRARYLLAPARKALSEGGAIDPEQLAPAYVRHEVARVP